MLSPRDISHTGFVVADVEAAMADLSRAMGLEWAPLTRIEMRLRFPDGARDVAMTFTYSVSPPHVELLAEVPGTPWVRALADDPVGLQAAHHVGMWSDDVPGDSAALAKSGAPRLATYDHAGTGAFGFAYHRLASGLVLELVDRAREPDFQRWYAGGSFVPATS